MNQTWKGERPRDPDAPQLDGTGEIRLEAPDRASGYFTTRIESRPEMNARTSGIYVRADGEDLRILDSSDKHRETNRVTSTSKSCPEGTEERLLLSSQGVGPKGDQEVDDDSVDSVKIRLPVRDSETVGDEGGGRP